MHNMLIAIFMKVKKKRRLGTELINWSSKKAVFAWKLHDSAAYKTGKRREVQ